MGSQRLTVVDRFWSKVQKTDECWMWCGTKDTWGYGQFSVRGKYVPSHRYVYELVNGPIPAGRQIDHRCHNRLCVNPAHLRAVSHKQNCENHNGATKASRSGVRGVYPYNYRGGWRWQVQVTHNGIRYWGGLFDRLADAEAAAITLRRSLHTHNDRDWK